MYFEESSGVFDVVTSDDFEAWDVTVHGSEALGVLGCDGGGWSVESSEDDWASEVSSGHVLGLGAGVDDVVDGLESEVHGHELDDGSESG